MDVYADPNMKAQLDWESRYNIFSCGVLVLEILSGQKDSGIHHGENVEDLLSFVSLPFVTNYFFYFVN